jgi:hypothetical protein
MPIFHHQYVFVWSVGHQMMYVFQFRELIGTGSEQAFYTIGTAGVASKRRSEVCFCSPAVRTDRSVPVFNREIWMIMWHVSK